MWMDTDYFFLVKFFICLLDTENSEEVISHVIAARHAPPAYFLVTKRPKTTN